MKKNTGAGGGRGKKAFSSSSRGRAHHHSNFLDRVPATLRPCRWGDDCYKESCPFLHGDQKRHALSARMDGQPVPQLTYLPPRKQEQQQQRQQSPLLESKTMDTSGDTAGLSADKEALLRTAVNQLTVILNTSPDGQPQDMPALEPAASLPASSDPSSSSLALCGPAPSAWGGGVEARREVRSQIRQAVRARARQQRMWFGKTNKPVPREKVQELREQRKLARKQQKRQKRANRQQRLLAKTSNQNTKPRGGRDAKTAAAGEGANITSRVCIKSAVAARFRRSAQLFRERQTQEREVTLMMARLGIAENPDSLPSLSSSASLGPFSL